MFLPGIVGVAVGRWRVDRNPPAPREGAPRDERADTDVFAAVRDDAPTGEVAPEHEGARATAATAVATKEREATEERETETVATPEREAATEVIPTTKRDAPTETIATSDAVKADEAAKTEVIPTHTDPKPSWPGSSATWSGPESEKD